MFSKHSDIKFGVDNELKLFKLLKDKFDSNLTRSISKYSIFDYSSELCDVELKTRKNNYDTYPDTMIGANKFEYANKTDKGVYFVFSFFDGNYYYKYDKKDVDNGLVQFRQGGRKDRGFNEINQYAFIPISSLIKI
jgi:hypothetical protein